MKNTIRFISITLTFALLVISCQETDDNAKPNDIVHNLVNEEYVVIRNVQTLQASNDEISNHIDSILSGLIDEEFISTGEKTFDLNGDNNADIGFEIIDLHNFNKNDLPVSFDSLAARVSPLSVEILDNSTYGYPDGLDLDDPISETGYWSDKISVLGTFGNVGQFQGKGDRYLGFRFIQEEEYEYGWIKIYCSQHNDTLRIIEYAYNKIPGSSINAGQKE